MASFSTGFRLPDSPKKPALSLILCSRNDQYMGNSRWRLQTTLNYVARRVQELSREEDVEVVVADWGSDIPLRDILELSPAAARMVSFILIPPDVARTLQKDSPFPEVLALNAAVRRAAGTYVGRIDQDTLVGKRFLRFFFALYDGRRQLEVPLNEALLFANRRSIPYRFADRCPSLGHVELFIRLFGGLSKVWRHNRFAHDVFWTSYVGIWLLHRDLWDRCGGYDERLIYYNWMETDMILRLSQNRRVTDLGKKVGYDFYHLEHYNPVDNLLSRAHGIKNPDVDLGSHPQVLNPNGSDWGLIQHHFEKLPQSPDSKEVGIATVRQSPSEWGSFLFVLGAAGAHVAWDNVFTVKSSSSVVFAVWKRRAAVAWETVRGQSLFGWPRLLLSLWVRKRHGHE